ncbi:SgcJ/EcaC family oxidoreductase [Mycobacterium sp.]|uniref:SgcJ/EcaC family oxidoreductase n=1 Tax=Mycobacterium sp. TaxID=1785 RepID=UPI00334051D9
MADDLSGATRTDRSADEDAIRELLDRQIMGWDAGDSEAYASVFTSDADYITFLGSHYKGRDAIAASYAPLLRKLLKGSRLHTKVAQLRFLSPDVALIQTDAAVIKGTRRNRRKTRVNTSIAVRTEDGWLLAASQNTTHRWLAEKLMGELVSRQSHE